MDRPIYKIRLSNVRRLADMLGSQDKLADALDVSKSYISQIIGRRPVRIIGDDIAQAIETAFRLPAGWLDLPHDDSLLDVASRLSAADRASVLDYARSLLPKNKRRAA